MSAIVWVLFVLRLYFDFDVGCIVVLAWMDLLVVFIWVLLLGCLFGCLV